jgi:hypothetical protein
VTVYSEDIGKHFRTERVLDRFQPTGFVVEVAQIGMHEGYEPDALADLGHAHVLARKDVAQVDLPAVETGPTAARHRDGVIVERIRFPIGAAEGEVRQVFGSAFIAKSVFEVGQLVALGSEPQIPAVGQYGVEEHQPLDHATERRHASVPIVGFTDGFVERLVVHVNDASAVERARCDHCRAAALDQLTNKVVCLLSVRHACEGAVLPIQKHAAVDHHVNENRASAR